MDNKFLLHKQISWTVGMDTDQSIGYPVSPKQTWSKRNYAIRWSVRNRIHSRVPPGSIDYSVSPKQTWWKRNYGICWSVHKRNSTFSWSVHKRIYSRVPPGSIGHVRCAYQHCSLSSTHLKPRHQSVHNTQKHIPGCQSYTFSNIFLPHRLERVFP